MPKDKEYNKIKLMTDLKLDKYLVFTFILLILHFEVIIMEDRRKVL